MDESSFHELADNLLSSLLEAIEIADDDNKVDAELQDGVLTIQCGESGEYIINKHEPSRQIWVSSPLSGASRYSYDEDNDEWVRQNGEIFKEKISEELSEIGGIDVEF